jgi:hypothetical protein
MNSLSLSGLGLLPRQAILMLLTSLQQALVLSVTQSRSIRAILGDMSDSYYQGLRRSDLRCPSSAQSTHQGCMLMLYAVWKCRLADVDQ